MTATLTIIAEVVVVLGFILARQLMPRRIKDNPLKLPLILGAIGVVNAMSFIGNHRVAPGEVAGGIAGLLVATAIAWPRAESMRVWREPDGSLMRQGTLRTVGWWAVAIAGHVVTAFAGPLLFGEKAHGFGGFDSATVLVYLGVSLGAQAWFLERRLRHAVGDSRRQGAAMLLG